MGRYDFQSPGAAFSSEIAKLLAERKAEERQQLMDSLAVKAEERAAAASAEQRMMNQASLREQEARMGSQRQQDEIQRLGAITPFLTMGQDVSNMPDENIGLGQKYGAFQMKNAPEVSTEITGMEAEGQQLEGEAPPVPFVPNKPQPKWSYVGTPQEREKDRLRAATGAAIAAIEDPKIQKHLGMIAAANDGQLPEGILEQYTGETPISIFDEQSGSFKSGGTMPNRGKIITRDRPPASAYTTPPMQYNGADPTNPDMQVWIRRDGSTVKIPGRRGTQGAIGLPGYAETGLNFAINNLIQSPADPQAIANYRTTAARAVQNVRGNYSPTVRHLATQYINNPSETTQQMEQMIDAGQLTEEDMMQFESLTDSIVPQDIRHIITANPYATPTPKVPAGQRFLEWWNKRLDGGEGGDDQ